MNLVKTSAVIDTTQKYRYRLIREWGPGPVTCFVMLNPSTADATVDDPTIRRCIAFAKSWGCGSLVVVNLFAYRTPKPALLRVAVDPVGPENDQNIREVVEQAAMVVAAWGNDGIYRDRDREVLALLKAPLCLGITNRKAPRHPLYLRGDTRLVPFHGNFDGDRPTSAWSP